VVAGDGHSLRLRLSGGSCASRVISIVADNINFNVLCDRSVIMVMMVTVVVVITVVVMVVVMREQLVDRLGDAVLEGVVRACRRHALAYACTRLARQGGNGGEEREGERQKNVSIAYPRRRSNPSWRIVRGLAE
jgi:hypothetical protein